VGQKRVYYNRSPSSFHLPFPFPAGVSSHSYTMAPSATETTTLPTRTAETSTVKLTANIGPYKELAPIGYKKEVEEEGKDGFKAAKVCQALADLMHRACG